MFKKILKWLLGLILVLLLVLAGLVAWNWHMVQVILLGGLHVYETTPPALPSDIKHPAILVFSKTNGYRHEEAIPAANKLFADMAAKEGWGYFQTENGATFNPAILSKFDAVVFNNVSGDVFNAAQRDALKAFVDNGGGFVGIHGAGGDFKYDWRWYVDDLIGAQFKGHPLKPQFQQGTVTVEDKTHPATAQLVSPWQHTEEWYSFEKSVRRPGYNVLLTLDEGSYKPGTMFGTPLLMGGDHPVAWWHCQGKGRALYSAMGHQASAYAEPGYAQMLKGATRWALKLEGKGCEGNKP